MSEPAVTLSPGRRQALNQALDREREQRGLPTDVALAVDLGITPRVLSHWRNGRLTRVDTILVNVLVTEPAIE